MIRRSTNETLLRAEDAAQDAQSRIKLILRGPKRGVPLWVPKKYLPCSKCLRLVSRLKFAKGEDHRREPVCNACRAIVNQVDECQTKKTNC
jgi:hypothetical protein